MKKTGQTKKLLKLLNGDDCCANCPKLSEIEGNILECLEDGLYASIDDMGGLRFGVAGEDDSASQNRYFSLTGINTFEIASESYIAFNTAVGDVAGQLIAQPDNVSGTWSNPIANSSSGFSANSSLARLYFSGPLDVSEFGADGGTISMTQKDTLSAIYLNALAINNTLAQLIAQDVTTGIVANLNLDNTGAIQLRLNDTANTILSSINMDVFGTLHLQSTDALNYAEMQFYPSGAYIDNYNGTTNDEIYMEWQDGNLLTWEFLGAAVWNISGITQDDTSVQMLALDANGDVRFVDKATIGVAPGQSSVFAVYDQFSVADDASPNTGNSIAIEVGKRYSFEAYYFVTQSSGVGYNVNVNLPGSVGSSQFFVEFVAPASGGEIDTTLIKREWVNGESTFNLPNGSFHAPVGSPVLKITGFIDTNDTAGNVNITAALDSAGPQSGALTGWFKLTEIL